MPRRLASARVTAGLKCAPEIDPKVKINATSAAPVASVLARSARATLPPARRSPMIPDPMTAASSRAVPTVSAVTRRASENRCGIVMFSASVDLRSSSTLRQTRVSLHGRFGVNKQRVLFLCTHNSARSQMAEGFLRSRYGDRFEVASAGTEATGVHPLAMQAMAETGVD